MRGADIVDIDLELRPQVDLGGGAGGQAAQRLRAVGAGCARGDLHVAVEGDARTVGGDTAEALLGPHRRRVVGHAYIGIVGLGAGAERGGVPAEVRARALERHEGGAARGGCAARDLDHPIVRIGADGGLQRLEVTRAIRGLQESRVLEARTVSELDAEGKIGERAGDAEVSLQEPQRRAGAQIDAQRRMPAGERDADDLEFQRLAVGHADLQFALAVVPVQPSKGEIDRHGGYARLRQSRGRAECDARRIAAYRAARKFRAGQTIDQDDAGTDRALRRLTAEQRRRGEQGLLGERRRRRPLQALDAA